MKSLKTHLTWVAANIKFTFEELTTILTQIEAYMNSRPLRTLPCGDDGVDALTTGHFVIGCPLEALPDPSFSYQKLCLLHQCHCVKLLCETFGRGGPHSISPVYRRLLSGIELRCWRRGSLTRRWNGPHTMATRKSYQCTHWA